MHVCTHTQICVYMKLTHARLHTYPVPKYSHTGLCYKGGDTAVVGMVRELQGSWPGSGRAWSWTQPLHCHPEPLSSLSLSETPFRMGPLGSMLIALPALFSVSLFLL